MTRPNEPHLNSNSVHTDEPDMEPLYNIVVECIEDSNRWFPQAVNSGIPGMTICMAGELGEFANMVKKITRGSLNPDDPTVMHALRLELVDLFIYLCNTAAMLQLDLAATYKTKREFNEARFGVKIV